jgi:hypothetical protein
VRRPFDRCSSTPAITGDLKCLIREWCSSREPRLALDSRRLDCFLNAATRSLERAGIRALPNPRRRWRCCPWMCARMTRCGRALTPFVERLGAVDMGDVTPPVYRDYVRPPGRARNEQEVLAYCAWLSDRVATAAAQGRFVVLLGGDCSIVLGALCRRPSVLNDVDRRLSYMTISCQCSEPRRARPSPS